MVVKHSVKGYDSFCKFMETFDGQGQPIHVYFGGNKDANNVSWCSDCVRAYPIVEKALEKAPPNSHFISVEVGDREVWKDPQCSFRKDPKTKLMVVPTLVRWKGPQRLEGLQCEKPELVEMLFTDEE